MKRFILSALLLASCSKPQSVPIDMEYAKVEEFSTPNQSVYILFAHDPIEGQYYNLMGIPPSGKVTSLGMVQADSVGQLWKVEGNETSPYYLALDGYGVGEYIDIYLNGIQESHVRITPNSNTIVRDGYYFVVERNDHLGNEFRIYGEGFEPREKVSVFTTNNGRIYTDTYETTPTGHFNTVVDLWTEGSGSGEANLTIEGSKGVVELTIPWGKKYWETNKTFIAQKMKDEKEYLKENPWAKEYVARPPEQTVFNIN